MHTNSAFSIFRVRDNDVLFEDEDIIVRGYVGNETLSLFGGTSFMFVQEGFVEFSHRFSLTSGMYLCGVNGWFYGEFCKAMIVTHKHHFGMFAMGGPVERVGRLRYIDGASDTPLIAPIKLGDPCLNHLHFPPHTVQTPHTHPSHRVGMIHRGRGVCVTEDRETQLLIGDMFLIRKDGVHSFNTSLQTMDVIAFHPDSEVGNTDEVHQMLTATKVV